MSFFLLDNVNEATRRHKLVDIRLTLVCSAVPSQSLLLFFEFKVVKESSLEHDPVIGLFGHFCLVQLGKPRDDALVFFLSPLRKFSYC